MDEYIFISSDFAAFYGGQNLIEALACHCPVILGEHTFNFADASASALAQGLARRAAHMPQALALAISLNADTPAPAAFSAYLQTQQGGIGRTLDSIKIIQSP